MLKIEIPASEIFNEADSTFAETNAVVLSLEHSLLSVSKWESKWCVPFLSKDEKTAQQTLDYVKCMTVTQNVSDSAYLGLNEDNVEAIKQYIDHPMSATIISDRTTKNNGEVVTSEIIYYWMIALQIPFECQKWHLNRLLMLINVCSIKQESPRQMSTRKILSDNKALNEARKARLRTRG